jgi:acetylornithine deacetylase/succinyl-diaminopimelate desuccinylase family protein
VTSDSEKVSDRILASTKEQDAVKLLQDLIRFETVNPPGNEGECIGFIADLLRGWGLEVEIWEREKGRGNVVAAVKGSERKPQLIYNGHIDVVVPGEGWTLPPFEGRVANGRVYGRGASDMKGGVAAFLMAARALLDSDARLRGDLVLTVVSDEENLGPLGTPYLIERGLRGDMAVVTEPTGLGVEVCQRGVFWFEVTTIGRTAHGGRPWLGINAIDKMTKVLQGLRRLESDLSSRKHPLLSPPTFSVGKIQGGTKTNIVAERCTVSVDRRTVPGETKDSVEQELAAMLQTIRKDDPEFNGELNVIHAVEPFEISEKQPLVETLTRCVRDVTGTSPKISGKNAATDASWLANLAKIPTVLFGPGDYKTSHTSDEHIEISKLMSGTRVLSLLAERLLR